MSGFLKFVGLIACLYGVYYVFTNFNEQTKEYITYFFGVIGLIASLFFLIRLLFGKKWKSTLFKRAVVGEDLVKAIEDTLEEFPKVKNKTWASLSGNLIFRFTRIGLVVLIITTIPIMLLFQQNNKIDLQNDLIVSQNSLLLAQNERLDQQTYLIEAERRGTLVHLFSNIMDVIDKELKDDFGQEGKRDLSAQLIGRIVALSRALKPYHYLKNDTLIERPLSPERGQLLTALVLAQLDKTTFINITEQADFSYAHLEGADLSHQTFKGINLDGANLRAANLSDCTILEGTFIYSELYMSNFYKSVIIDTKFNNSNLERSNFLDSNLQDNMFTGANLKSSLLLPLNLEGYNFYDAIFTDAFVSDINFLSKVEDGVFINKGLTTSNLMLHNSGDGNVGDLLFDIEYFENENFDMSKIKNKGPFYMILSEDAF